MPRVIFSRRFDWRPNNLTKHVYQPGERLVTTPAAEAAIAAGAATKADDGNGSQPRPQKRDRRAAKANA